MSLITELQKKHMENGVPRWKSRMENHRTAEAFLWSSGAANDRFIQCTPTGINIVKEFTGTTVTVSPVGRTMAAHGFYEQQRHIRLRMPSGLI